MEDINEYRYKRAKDKVNALKSFYSSLIAYCVVIPLLAYFNYSTTSFPWVIFPAVGWGIGLLCKWMDATGRNLILGRDWEERKIREFMDGSES
ncbi:2TM domain-containing protein [Flagellimonas flava]|uniref:2TM domain-containing protein n=1 Tax=Flagellimonas flava TaxID=570519 RepID=A0A1M5I233_9FLAO|nr:2TM domain-containing protein [Allomuricauda flava]SHG22338.1 2TM domain-containing protein [Allomuricauda flava]